MKVNMDSRLLYNAAKYLNSYIIWEHDWIHFGTGKEINSTLVISIINEFFDDESLHFIQNRNNSGTYKRSEINTIIDNLLGHAEFQLWNIAMDRVIKIDEIGVLQLGRKKVQKDLNK
jgi:hypothetical protein